MIGLDTFFEKPVARRLEPWMKFSFALTFVLLPVMYILGPTELAHWAGAVLTTTDLLVVASVLAAYTLVRHKFV